MENGIGKMENVLSEIDALVYFQPYIFHVPSIPFPLQYYVV
jgi:hypothetical protein